MQTLNFFSHEKISDRLYIVTEGYSMIHRMTIGVVVGDEKILVIDSGNAMTDDLKDYIIRIPGIAWEGKKFLCVCSHLHPDHISGAVLFDEAYCSHEDYPSGADFAFSLTERTGDLEELCLHNQEVKDYCSQHMIVSVARYFEDVKDGDIFDLGGINVQAIALPGHTDGHMAYWIPSLGHAFPGDGINTDTHITPKTKEQLAGFRDALKRFIEIVGDDVVLHPAHLYVPMDISVAKHVLKAYEDIIDGNIADDPPGDTMFAYRNLRKPNTENMYIHYVGNAGVTYDLEKTHNGPHTDHYNFYSHEKAADRVWIVTENYSVVHHFTIGVIEGDEKILVIGAGMGMTDELRGYIEGIVGSEKPMWCVCPGGAMECVGGAGEFDRAFLNEADRGMLKKSLDDEVRASAFADYALYEPRDLSYMETHAQKNLSLSFENVKDGDLFSLGGVDVQIIEMPGSTPGQVLCWLPEQKVLFTGDAVNIYTHLEELNSEGLRAYEKQLQGILRRCGEDLTMFALHTNRPHGARVLKALICCCEKVLSGDTACDPPAETIFGKGANDRRMRMHYEDNCCICYNAEGIGLIGTENKEESK